MLLQFKSRRVLLKTYVFMQEEEAGMLLLQRLASLGDIYVSFWNYRAQADIAQFSNGKMFWIIIAKEIESLNKVLKNSEKPVKLFELDLKYLRKLRLSKKTFLIK
jgi:3-phosphoglycerate kinase